MTTFDPKDIDAVQHGLASLLANRYPGLTVPERPVRFSGGLDTHVYDVLLAGEMPEGWPRRVVLRVYPVPDQNAKAEREFAIQRFASERGFPAPAPLFLDTSGEPWGLPFMLMERAPGPAVLDRFKNPLRLRGTLRHMAALHARLHSLPTDGCPLPYDRPLIDRLLDEPRSLLAEYPSPAAESALGWLDRHADLVRDEEPVLVHNDFHPVNVVAEGNQFTLLDWSDAALGDRHSDVARTLAVFSLAPDFEQSRPVRLILRVLRPYIVSRYVRDYDAHFRLNRKRLRYWGAAHAFSEWVTVETMERYGEGAIGARAGVADEIPRKFSLALARYFEDRSGHKTGAQDSQGS